MQEAGCAGTLVEGIIDAAYWELLAEARLSDARWRSIAQRWEPGAAAWDAFPGRPAALLGPSVVAIPSTMVHLQCG